MQRNAKETRRQLRRAAKMVKRTKRARLEYINGRVILVSTDGNAYPSCLEFIHDFDTQDEDCPVKVTVHG